QPDGLRDLRGGGLGAAVAGARTAHRAAVAARDHEALGAEREDRARNGTGRSDHAPRLVEPETRTTPERVRPWLRVAAADEIVDLGRRPRPVDDGVVIADERIVARPGFVLRDAGRPALPDERDPVGHGADAERTERPVVERPGRGAATDPGLAPQKDRSRTHPRGGPEDAHAAPRPAAAQPP